MWRWYDLIKKLCNTLLIYVAMVIVTFSLLITQANPAFLQNNLLSKRLFAYSLLNNFSNVIVGVLLILIGYQIKGTTNNKSICIQQWQKSCFC